MRYADPGEGRVYWAHWAEEDRLLLAAAAAAADEAAEVRPCRAGDQLRRRLPLRSGATEGEADRRVRHRWVAGEALQVLPGRP